LIKVKHLVANLYTKEDLASYQTAMQPRTLETYRGSWEDMVYSLPLGVDANSAIKLELGYLGGHDSAGVYFQWW